MRNFLRSLVYAFPALFAYTVLLPNLALYLDNRAGFGWNPPIWLAAAAWLAIGFGAFFGLWGTWLFGNLGRGTPNPMKPPQALVTAGPFRYSRNPIMLGGWLFGAGLAVILGSLSLLGLVAVIAVSGVVYVRLIEEPSLAARFGDAWSQYSVETPRWLCGR